MFSFTRKILSPETLFSFINDEASLKKQFNLFLEEGDLISPVMEC